MSESESKVSQKDADYLATGVVMWQLFVSGPLWWAMQFMMLQALGDKAGVSLWTLFFCYVPTACVGQLLVGLYRLFLNRATK